MSRVQSIGAHEEKGSANTYNMSRDIYRVGHDVTGTTRGINMLSAESAGKHVTVRKRGKHENVRKRGKTCGCYKARET